MNNEQRNEWKEAAEFVVVIPSLMCFVMGSVAAFCDNPDWAAMFFVLHMMFKPKDKS